MTKKEERLRKRIQKNLQENIHLSDEGALLLEKGLVAVVPGSGFDAPNYVRWSYATSIDAIRSGMNRLEKFLELVED